MVCECCSPVLAGPSSSFGLDSGNFHKKSLPWSTSHPQCLLQSPYTSSTNCHCPFLHVQTTFLSHEIQCTDNFLWEEVIWAKIIWNSLTCKSWKNRNIVKQSLNQTFLKVKLHIQEGKIFLTILFIMSTRPIARIMHSWHTLFIGIWQLLFFVCIH